MILLVFLILGFSFLRYVYYAFDVNTVFQKTGTFLFFCYNFVSRNQILVIFGKLVAKEILQPKIAYWLKRNCRRITLGREPACI